MADRVSRPLAESARGVRARLRLPVWRDLISNPVTLRRLLNVWPPFRAAGIRVVELADDWSRVTVQLRLAPLTRNYMGTQFGGSMFAMTDPFWVILLIHRLGPGYTVWDRRAEIDFLAPGRTDVRCTIEVSDQVVEELRAEAAGGSPALRWVHNDIVDRHGAVIARVRREVYVRQVTRAGR